MIEVAQILGITMKRSFGKLQNILQEMMQLEKGQTKQQNAPRTRKKPKERRELENLVSSIKYDRPGGEKQNSVRLLTL